VPLTAVQPLTYLQLVQALFYEVGAAGFAPTTTVGQTGEARRLVNWVHDAELDIQNLWVDWKWLRKSQTSYTGLSGDQTGIYTTQGGAISAFPLDLAEWDYKSFRIYPIGSTTYQVLPTYEWQQVRDEVFDLTDRGQPWRAIVMPDNTLRFDLIPDQSYQLYQEWRTVPYDLKNDTDVSAIPARFANRIIVEFARLKYGLFENAAEQVQHAKDQIYGVLNASGVMTTQGLLTQLENDQLPNSKSSRLQQGNDIVVGGGDGSDGQFGYGRYW
jgi:hypothetical protein